MYFFLLFCFKLSYPKEIGALLMLIHIWRHLGGFTKEILDGYGKLVAIDPYRREYYKEESNASFCMHQKIV